jgi:hypothetical protein
MFKRLGGGKKRTSDLTSADELFTLAYGGESGEGHSEIASPQTLRQTAESLSMDLITEISDSPSMDKTPGNPFLRSSSRPPRETEDKVDEMVRRVNACWLINLSNCDADTRFRVELEELKKDFKGVKQATSEVAGIKKHLEDVGLMAAYALLLAGLVFLVQLFWALSRMLV